MLATTFILAALALPSVTIASPLLETRAASSRYASPLTTWDLQGCAMDKYPNARVLSGAGYYSNNGVSITNCLNYCDSQGAVFAGVENANQCFCSNVGLENGGAYGPTGANLKQTSNDGCNLSCKGSNSQACGGSNYIQVYKSNKRVTPTVPTVSGATYLGCFPDNVNKRLLPTLEAQGDMANTNEKCVATCRAAGLDLAGTEYANECWCGSSSKVSLPAKTTGCSQSCSGAQGEICGGGSRLTVYKLSGVSNGGGSGGSGSGSGGSGGSGSVGSGTSPATPPASNPASYTYNGATYQYQGCYTDRSDGAGRALTDYYSSSNARTVEGCLRSCQNAGNFLYAGLEYGSECRCGNSLASFSTPTGTCNKPCSSGNGEICGGNYALTLYAQPQQQASTTPASTGSSGSSTSPAAAGGASSGSTTNGGAAGGSSSTSPAAAGGASSGSTTTGGAASGSPSTNGGAASGSSTSTTTTGGAAGGSSSTTTGGGSAAAVN